MREHLGGIIMDCCNIDDAVLPLRLFQGKRYSSRRKKKVSFKKKILRNAIFQKAKFFAVLTVAAASVLMSNVILM